MINGEYRNTNSDSEFEEMLAEQPFVDFLFERIFILKRNDKTKINTKIKQNRFIQNTLLPDAYGDRWIKVIEKNARFFIERWNGLCLRMELIPNTLA